MDRRQFLTRAAFLPLLATGCAAPSPRSVARVGRTFRRLRPGDPDWPSEAAWQRLNDAVGGRLIRVESPLSVCEVSPQSPSCRAVLESLRNPFFLGDHPALTQTSGWAGAWTSSPSVYAVAAERASDVAAAVRFAGEHDLRLVVRGGGHSYQGTSNAPDSLLIWTRRMDGVTLHDSFVPQGCRGAVAAQPAVTVGAGATWGPVYDAVTTRGGRYVQGGGCTTVGVAGLIQSGGFGSFSKRYGLAAAGLLEAEVVTADGEVRIANACTHPDLFWALKGGGGGSFGVVTRLTLRTHELPTTFGAMIGRIAAASDEAYRRLVARTMAFYAENLLDPGWGEQIRFHPGRLVSFQMVFQGFGRDRAEEVWTPFLDWVRDAPEDYSWEMPPLIVDVPARRFWDGRFMEEQLPGLIYTDDRAAAPAANFAYAGDRAEAGQFIHAYRSVWLPSSLLVRSRQVDLVEALVAGSEHWTISLHCNKGLAGAPAEVVAAARDTAMNPVALDSFALAIVAANSPPAFPQIPGSAPDLSRAQREAGAVDRAVSALLNVVPNPGSYVSESDFFEANWSHSYWGENYPRLAKVKERYDPTGLFIVHNGVGSETWSVDGFTRVPKAGRG